MHRRAFVRAAVLALAASRVHAQQPPTRMRYGGDAAFAPFEYLDEQGRPAGFQIELLGALGKEMGIEFDIVLEPWPQVEAAFREGTLDLAAMVVTDERANWARFARGHATPALSFYFMQGRREPNGLDDLAGLRLAVLDGEAMRDTLARWFVGIPGPVLKLPDAQRALAAVRDDQADIALLPRAYADRLLSEEPFRQLVASHQMLPLQTYAFALQPGREAFQRDLQAALDRLETDGRLEALRVRWLSSHHDVAQRVLLQRDLARESQRIGWLAAGAALGLAALGFGLWRRGRAVAAETTRRRSAEALMRHAFSLHADPMVLIDRSGGKVRDANAAMLALLGLKPEEVIDHPLDLLDRHCDEAELRFLVRTLDEEGALNAFPLRLRRTDGTQRDCLITGDILQIGAETYLFCVVRDITEQLAASQALRRTYDEMFAELNVARRELDGVREARALAENRLHEFTRSVAHDLKTPINAVQSFSGLLHQRLAEGDVQEASRYSAHIERAAKRMTAMIDALAKLAQVGSLPLARAQVDMQRLADDTWQIICAGNPARQVQIRIGALPPAMADPDLAAQVWQNLLGNAWKYTGHTANAAVSVDSHRDARGTWYRITDNGAGFDMTKAKRLFQPFQRMHSSTRFEGSGVGLSLVRRIVEHHEGEVRLRSTVDVGTIAEFTLDPK